MLVLCIIMYSTIWEKELMRQELKRARNNAYPLFASPETRYITDYNQRDYYSLGQRLMVSALHSKLAGECTWPSVASTGPTPC